MEAIKGQLQSALLNWDSSKHCEIHNMNYLYMPGGQESGESYCPICWRNAETEKLAKELSHYATNADRMKKHNTLGHKSIIQDNTIKQATFDSFKPTNAEEERNKKHALNVASKYCEGEVFNTWIQSAETGVGKSHLAMSILKVVNAYGSRERSCLFVDVARMMELIKDSFNNKNRSREEQSIYTEEYFTTLCGEVDLLVLDDLGAETGDIYSTKRASEYTSNVLRSIFNARQGKSTIVTTNLSGQRLTGYKDENGINHAGMYDKKMISRAMVNIESIVFKESVDKRPSKLEF